jgi:type I restriction enzyme R subunit
MLVAKASGCQSSSQPGSTIDPSRPRSLECAPPDAIEFLLDSLGGSGILIGLADFQAAFGTDAAEVDTKNPQKNARVLIATYQTLDQDEGGEGASFFIEHYPPDYFDVIIIDECHRAAWGKWFVILENNKDAIQIGLTATPRQIRLPEAKDEETRRKIEEDRRLLADNLRYFGEPAYEYTYQQGVADGYLAPAEIEAYDLFHDQHEQPERVRGVERQDLAGKSITNAYTGQSVQPDALQERYDGPSLESRLVMPERVKVNALYAKWCRDNNRKRVQTYSFKCMASSNGQELIPDFRERQRSHFVATTKDLLTTAVNVPCVRNIVFFRYVQSPIPSIR